MSEPSLPRAPAWAGLRPAGQGFVPCPAATAGPVLAALASRGELRHKPEPDGQPARYFQFFPAGDGPALFLKRVSAAALDSQLQADRFARWLEQAGIRGNRLAGGFPMSCDGDQLLGYPLLQGRFPEASEPDLRLIGRQVGRLHAAFARLPWAEQVAAATEQREQRIQQSAAAASLTPDKVRLPRKQPQPLHGDLNPGNLLIDGDGRPLLLDFEDSPHSHFDRIVDLAMLIERLILIRCDDDARALTLATALRDGYLEQQPQDAPLFAGLRDTLGVMNRRALVLLSMLDDPAPGEQPKFIALLKQIELRQPLLQRLERL